MKWRFTDKITSLEAWKSIQGIKTVSLEEYHLLEWMGRKGYFPESLVVESCINMCRWLVAASSQFQQSCIAKEISNFTFMVNAQAGSMLSITIAVHAKADDELDVVCEVDSGGLACGRGNLKLALHPMKEFVEPKDVASLWQELYGKA